MQKKCKKVRILQKILKKGIDSRNNLRYNMGKINGGVYKMKTNWRKTIYDGLKNDVSIFVDQINGREKNTPNKVTNEWGKILVIKDNAKRDNKIKEFATNLVEASIKDVPQVSFSDEIKESAIRYAYGKLSLNAYGEKREKIIRLDKLEELSRLKGFVCDDVFSKAIDGEFNVFDKKIQDTTLATNKKRQSKSYKDYLGPVDKKKVEMAEDVARNITDSAMENFKTKKTVQSKDKTWIKKELFEYTKNQVFEEALSSEEKNRIALAKVEFAKAEQKRREAIANKKKESLRKNDPAVKYKDEIEQITGQLSLLENKEYRAFMTYIAAEKFISKHNLVKREKPSKIYEGNKDFYTSQYDNVNYWHGLFADKVQEFIDNRLAQREAKQQLALVPIAAKEEDQNDIDYQVGVLANLVVSQSLNASGEEIEKNIAYGVQLFSKICEIDDPKQLNNYAEYLKKEIVNAKNVHYDVQHLPDGSEFYTPKKPETVDLDLVSRKPVAIVDGKESEEDAKPIVKNDDVVVKPAKKNKIKKVLLGALGFVAAAAILAGATTGIVIGVKNCAGTSSGNGEQKLDLKSDHSKDVVEGFLDKVGELKEGEKVSSLDSNEKDNTLTINLNKDGVTKISTTENNVVATYKLSMGENTDNLRYQQNFDSYVSNEATSDDLQLIIEDKEQRYDDEIGGNEKPSEKLDEEQIKDALSQALQGKAVDGIYDSGDYTFVVSGDATNGGTVTKIETNAIDAENGNLTSSLSESELKNALGTATKTETAILPESAVAEYANAISTRNAEKYASGIYNGALKTAQGKNSNTTDVILAMGTPESKSFTNAKYGFNNGLKSTTLDVISYNANGEIIDVNEGSTKEVAYRGSNFDEDAATVHAIAASDLVNAPVTDPNNEYRVLGGNQTLDSLEATTSNTKREL